MRFFFYGTLLDPDVTALVLGRRMAPGMFQRAILPGHARWRVQGGSYPIVVPDARAEVVGAVVSGLSQRDIERLARYEGPGYRIAPLKVKLGGVTTVVSVFEPVKSRLQPSRDVWDLHQWQLQAKRAFISRVRAALSAPPAYSRP
ncbi:Gamma-glutamyl cyclotransferase, AIG2-like [Enhydrobacter aerosaccus]|uniref:Putative gamma-glutamylcyclotransferase n=1 Tax=Enhydrobacter aerosaccus TaxID=225324 RepID=A0A1T4LRE5_9HYPH|nr:gamma-glutamylcyclotransferase family protein [Enhydrobacter aerosaccus]SJZ57221.1 Gamma-glutamyl cyclotransferase, AIG2-like [Enhydrobacter aerosaccus]